jgi:hypothetical protein
MTATLGYARVSTTGQDLDTQLAVLTAAGVDSARVFTDKLSGAANTARPGLTAMLDYARAGDTVVVSAIDRLGRSVAEVTRTIADLADRRITLRALREGIDTATPTGRAVAAIMATLAECPAPLIRFINRWMDWRICLAVLVHTNGLGLSFQAATQARMSRSRACTLRWSPRSMSWRVSSANQRSTWLIQLE